MDRLRKRRDFLAAAKARKAGAASFLMQGRDRGDAGAARIGFTVTKKTGNSVVRNRIRRRLREAVRQVLPAAGQDGFDYVLVAREAALRTPFEGLVKELERAVRKLHAPHDAPRAPSGARPGGSPKSRGDRRQGADPQRGTAKRQDGGGSAQTVPDPAPCPAPARSASLSNDNSPTPADGGPRHE